MTLFFNRRLASSLSGPNTKAHKGYCDPFVNECVEKIVHFFILLILIHFFISIELGKPKKKVPPLMARPLRPYTSRA